MFLCTTSKCFLNTSKGSDLTTSLDILFQCLTTHLENSFFPHIQPEHLFEAILSIPITSYAGEEAAPHLTTASSVVESYKVSPSLLFS